MSERSSFNIGPNLENEKDDEAKKLYETHQNDPNNPQPTADAERHYEENREAYHNQAAMDMANSGKDVNTDRIKYSTSGNGGNSQDLKLKGDFNGDIKIGTEGNSGSQNIKMEGGTIKGNLVIGNKPPEDLY